MMNEYWIVTENKTGRIIAYCGDINDAIMMVAFDSENRSYSRQRFILDQVITVTSTTDKQLPGQIGLPAAKEQLPPIELQQQVWLPEDREEPVIVR
jgi:hypothetical protein